MTDDWHERDQQSLVAARGWDTLLVLDACRYDTFREIHPEYLRGDLAAVRSAGGSTPEFLRGTFGGGGFDDVVYVSANPYVSSQGAVLEGFDASALFHEVVDVWDWGVDPTLGAVAPSTLNDAVREARTDFPERPLIAHYIQPHVPFITEGKIQDHSNFVLRDPDPNGRVGEARNFLDNLLKFKVGKGRVWKVKRSLGLPPAEDMEVLLARDGPDGLRRAYEDNLRSALEAVNALLEDLDGSVVVTGDHGELLGEDGHYGHKGGSTHSVLRTVPWFEVDVEESRGVDPATRILDGHQAGTDERQSVEERLGNLGYV